MSMYADDNIQIMKRIWWKLSHKGTEVYKVPVQHENEHEQNKDSVMRENFNTTKY